MNNHLNKKLVHKLNRDYSEDQEEEEKIKYEVSALCEIKAFFIALKINFTLGGERHRENYIFREGTAAFVDRYPYITKNHHSGLYKMINSEWGIPNEIIPGQIWLGNCHHALSRSIIMGMGITHVLNLTKEINNEFEEEGVRYLKIPVHDYNHSVISIFFKEAWDFMNDHNFGRILVHCV